MNDDINNRVGGIEIELKGLTRTVNGLESDMRNVTNGLDNLAGTIRGLANKMNAEHKTKWGVLAGWATVVVAFLTVLGSLALTPVNTILKTLSDRQYSHGMSEAHIGIKTEVMGLEKTQNEIKKIMLERDKDLQEMIKIDSAQSQRIKSLEFEIFRSMPMIFGEPIESE